MSDFDLEISPGEAVGLVGFNGAGKSTLLKLIAGTALPTSGVIKTFGRTSSILELGVGFEPELNGLENAKLVGRLLGHSSLEIENAIKWIVDFSDIGRYFYEPIRTYSSGMQMRLAFSIATAIRPDILIIDEALAVGDLSFQHRCFERIRSFKKLGTTILLVSHDKNAILSLCDRAVLVHGGKKKLDGKPSVVFDLYNALMAEHSDKEIEQTLLLDGAIRTISGSRTALVEKIALKDSEGKSLHLIEIGETVQLNVVIEAKVDVEKLVFGFMIKDHLGQDIYGTNTALLDRPIECVPSGNTLEITFDLDLTLGVGQYSISTCLHNGLDHLTNNIHWEDLAFSFQMINRSKPSFVGKVDLSAKLNTVKINDGAVLDNPNLGYQDGYEKEPYQSNQTRSSY